MQKQLNHEEFKQVQKKQRNDIIFVLENFEHMENVGSAFRLADGFNISGIIIIADNELDMQKIHKTARNCEKNIPYKIVQTCEEALLLLNEDNYMPFNVEITSESKPLRDIDFCDYEKIALIVGNERKGISDRMLSLVPNSTHIEMYGNNSSLNVSTALAIATYHISESTLLKQTLKRR